MILMRIILMLRLGRFFGRFPLKEAGSGFPLYLLLEKQKDDALIPIVICILNLVVVHLK